MGCGAGVLYNETFGNTIQTYQCSVLVSVIIGCRFDQMFPKRGEIKAQPESFFITQEQRDRTKSAFILRTESEWSAWHFDNAILSAR